MDMMKNIIKKNSTKNLEGQHGTQRAHATLLYSESNTNPLHATKKMKKKDRNINPECKPKCAPLPQHQMKDTHTCAKT
jgi:hypothetical protein